MSTTAPTTTCHALLTTNLTLSLSPTHIPQTTPLRPPHSRSQSISSNHSRRSSTSPTSSTHSHTTSSPGSLASISGTYKLRPPFAKAPLHLPTTYVTVSRSPAPILGNMYVKLYGQSMSGETMSVNLCDRSVRRELEKLASEGTEKVRVVEGVKFMFVGVDR